MANGSVGYDDCKDLLSLYFKAYILAPLPFWLDCLSANVCQLQYAKSVISNVNGRKYNNHEIYRFSSPGENDFGLNFLSVRGAPPKLRLNTQWAHRPRPVNRHAEIPAAAYLQRGPSAGTQTRVHLSQRHLAQHEPQEVLRPTNEHQRREHLLPATMQVLSHTNPITWRGQSPRRQRILS